MIFHIDHKIDFVISQNRSDVFISVVELAISLFRFPYSKQRYLYLNNRYPFLTLISLFKMQISLFEIQISHIPMPKRSNDPRVNSLSAKPVPHRYLCEISVANTRQATRE